MPKTHRDLVAWQLGMDLAQACYVLCRTLPKDERFGLVSQINRSAVSIPANIAEGHGRFTRADFARFLTIAHGSLTELDTHLEVALRRGYLSREEADQILPRVTELGKMIRSFRATLRGR
jgi:four helix bundle protein